MVRRRGWKSGDWLAKDEESGFTTYGSKLEYDYYGVLQLKGKGDRAHPQDFVKAKEDPYPVYPVSQPLRDYSLDESVVGFFVGTTTVPTSLVSPAFSIYRPGVDFATIEYDLFVF